VKKKLSFDELKFILKYLTGKMYYFDMTYCTHCGSQNTCQMSSDGGDAFTLLDIPNVIGDDAQHTVTKHIDSIYTMCKCNDCGNLFALIGKDVKGS